MILFYIEIILKLNAEIPKRLFTKKETKWNKYEIIYKI